MYTCRNHSASHPPESDGVGPSVEQLFGYAVEQIAVAAGELRPGEWLQLAEHVPSVTGYVQLGEEPMPDSSSATRIDAAEASVTVGPWWNAVEVPSSNSHDTASGPIVVAEIDASPYADLAARMTGSPHEGTVYARAPILVARGNEGFGLPLATSGHASVPLFLTVSAGAPAARAEQCRSLAEADFFSTKTEDRYPDIFGLALVDSVTRDQARAIVRERLACLPHYAVTLGHDVTANIDVLSKIVASV